MTETSGPGQPIPAGWYPTGDGHERWWDGNAWSQHHVRPVQPAPTPYGAPPAGTGGYGGGTGVYGGYASAPGQPYYVAPPGSQGGSTARTVLIVLGLVLVLLVGGCVAVVGVTGLAVNSAVDEIEADDAAPGGADNPVEITVGEAFSAQGFSYAAGWSLGVDALDDLTIEGLTVTNTSAESDLVQVEITLLQGTTQVAQATCTGSSVPPGASAEMSCYSLDPVPTAYDTVTVNDTF